jgi:hypothetical protein
LNISFNISFNKRLNLSLNLSFKLSFNLSLNLSSIQSDFIQDKLELVGGQPEPAGAHHPQVQEIDPAPNFRTGVIPINLFRLITFVMGPVS